jgi:16S rRNA (guanine527-N7)-methyltransferase
MSPPGRPKGESLSAQREGSPMSPPGRPKGESLSAQREACPVLPPSRPNGAGPVGGKRVLR